MSLRIRVPKLTNSSVIIRLAQDQHEIDAANRLVYRNYVNLYWPDDEEAFRSNKYLSTPARRVFVAVAPGQGVIGTMSVIKDSPLGLPSDTFQPEILRQYRQQNERLAEITSFAVEQDVPHPMNLILFLIKFLMQYSFYFGGIDRLVASCRPKHADFYKQRLCFQSVAAATPYAYAGNVACEFVTLHLLQAHLLLSQRYQDQDPSEENFYRFLFVEEHPNVNLPDKRQMLRPRQLDWVALARIQAAPIPA